MTGGTSLIKPVNKHHFKEFDLEKFSPEKKVFSNSNSLSLDEFIEKNKINFVDLIKCDAEGAEPEIVEGLKKNSNKVDYIVIDTIGERNGEDTTEIVVKLLKENIPVDVDEELDLKSIVGKVIEGRAFDRSTRMLKMRRILL